MSSFSRPGAVDLSAFKNPAPQQPPAGGAPRAGAPAPAGGAYVVDVTEQNFQAEVVEASMTHVVVLSLWSARSPESETFNATLAEVTETYAGRILLARVDVDVNPQIAQAVGAQGVPFVLGLVSGRPVPLFQGTVDAEDVRRYFDELVKVAISNGVAGTAAPRSTVDPEADGDEDDPRFAEADERLGADDLDGAVAAYEALVAQNPKDVEAAERLAGVKLMQRTRGADLESARRAAADDPADVDAQLLVADLDLSGGHVDDAFSRLIDLVRRTFGDDRDRVREHLVELFTVAGADDPRVGPARRALSAALF
ncbi:MAG: tetratricopeptide repeat protein [Nocardioidaceae bacterium]|nr:tetratricopeptide repeat protein [Nocardioidaceae bacterium]